MGCEPTLKEAPQAASWKVYATQEQKVSTLDHRVLFCALLLTVHSDNQLAKHDGRPCRAEPTTELEKGCPYSLDWTTGLNLTTKSHFNA